MNTSIRAAVIGGALTALAACGPRPISLVATVELDDASVAELETAAELLAMRCRSLVGSYTSQVSATAVSGGVQIEFRGESPSDEVVRLYSSTQGVMRIAAPDSPLVSIVTDQDVESATPELGASGPMLDLVLSDRAGQRMLEYTQRHLGSNLVTTWDGEDISMARISGIFGRRFQTTDVARETVMLHAIVLRSGRLPKPVKSVRIDHPTR